MINEIRNIIKNSLVGITTIEPTLKILNFPSWQDVPFCSISLNQLDFRNPENENSRFVEGQALCDILIYIRHNEKDELLTRTDNLFEFVNNAISNLSQGDLRFVDSYNNTIIINSINIKRMVRLIYEKNQDEIIMEINLVIDFYKF